MADEQLINLVREHPALYDKSRADFQDAMKKRTSWRYIADQLQFDVAEVQRWWRNIRDRYVCTKKDCVVHSGQEPPNHRSRWELYPFLTFLEDFVAHRPTSSNLDSPSTSAARQSTGGSPPSSLQSSPDTFDGSSHHEDLDVADIGIPLDESVSSLSAFTSMPVTQPHNIPEVSG